MPCLAEGRQESIPELSPKLRLAGRKEPIEAPNMKVILTAVVVLVFLLGAVALSLGPVFD
jgi:hypothetical protein